MVLELIDDFTSVLMSGRMVLLGRVIAAGSDTRIADLAVMQAARELGCFGLTEKFCGVNSGMVVETVADFDPATREYMHGRFGNDMI